MRILITGGRGMLGTDLCEILGWEHDCTPVGTAEMDVTSLAAVTERVHAERPELILHSAAYTDVDGCERDPDRAFRVNALGTWHVASAAASIGAAVIVISTDFVFDGQQQAPYTEFDATRPISEYGASKRAGEQLAAGACPRCTIVRTQWLYGIHGRCFPDTLLRAAAAGRPLRVVSDQIGAPTFTRDVAGKIAHLLRGPGARGEAGAGVPPLLPIYHINNSGACSWYDFAVAILRGAGFDHVPIEPIPAAEWPSPAPRPAYSVLRRRALELVGADDLRPWQDALAEFLQERQARGAGRDGFVRAGGTLLASRV